MLCRKIRENSEPSIRRRRTAPAQTQQLANGNKPAVAWWKALQKDYVGVQFAAVCLPTRGVGGKEIRVSLVEIVFPQIFFTLDS